ncbi:hypothetical protein CJP74_01705 [Psittacicella melopsittaci]|uniref:Chromosome partition protein MukF n=1 Tax=Psittacicella melopsittaci TaxID=2028576 RepID=A0A3A1YBJ3_9GAMM|nr:condensin subunit MukF [Psittacicella melopsittaci]RIY33467.1 hypothetical protein CJP74_01705 [Psittacicella melopsittaci]
MESSQANFHLNDLLEWVNNNGFSINLSSDRIGFLLAIHTFQRTSTSELSEEILIDLYRQVLAQQNQNASDLTEATSAARANKIINDMVTQKLLNRFSLDFAEDPDVANQSSIYRLSPLAIGIADNYIRQKEFSQVGLSVQLSMVAKEMNEITQVCTQRGDYSFWRTNVYAPLRYSVAEIFDLIDYRQRELDEDQHQIKQQISELLSQNWAAAIDKCKDLLASTGDTLRELQDTLSSAGDKLQAQLITIYYAVNHHIEALNTLAILQNEPELKNTLFRDNVELLALVEAYQTEYTAEDLIDLEAIFAQINELIGHLQTKLDRIISWGQQSIDLWIGFDRHIHKFIRNTIDLDKNRVFSTRLRRSVSEYLQQPFFLTYVEQERILDMRVEAQDLVEGEEIGEIPEALTYESYDNIQEQIAQAMQMVLTPFKQKQEPLDVAFILRNILRDNPLAIHFDVARIFVEQAMRLGVSADELAGVQALWQDVNEQHAQVQAHVINRYPA